MELSRCSDLLGPIINAKNILNGMDLRLCFDLFGQIIKHLKCFGLRYKTNDVLTFLARSSTPKIFRPEARNSFR
jgi:hypothetical protein